MANSDYRIELFCNSAGHPSGYGQGQTYLGCVSVGNNQFVTTDGSGNVALTYRFARHDHHGDRHTSTHRRRPGQHLGICSYDLLDFIDTLSTTDPPINPNNDALTMSNYVTTTQLPTEVNTNFDTTTTDNNNFRIEIYDPTCADSVPVVQLQVIRQGVPVGGPVNYSLSYQPASAGNSRLRFCSDVLRLVSNDVDNAASGYGATSDPYNQTIEVQLGDVIQVTYQPRPGR